jgi:hypothetical protein
VALLLHGCSHSAGDFWPQSFYCRTCLGLPEEMSAWRAAGQGSALGWGWRGVLGAGAEGSGRGGRSRPAAGLVAAQLGRQGPAGSCGGSRQQSSRQQSRRCGRAHGDSRQTRPPSSPAPCVARASCAPQLARQPAGPPPGHLVHTPASQPTSRRLPTSRGPLRLLQASRARCCSAATRWWPSPHWTGTTTAAGTS